MTYSCCAFANALGTRLRECIPIACRPHLIYTWGGGVLFAEVEAGFLQDISVQIKGAWGDTFSPAALDAMSYKGKIYGAPFQATEVVLWYNKALLAKAGVDTKSLESWDGLLDATKMLKAAGVTREGQSAGVSTMTADVENVAGPII
jgi:ABC-type glycerol-3-phosphate transport system substrate-binding protein